MRSRARAATIALLGVLASNQGRAQQSDTTVIRAGPPLHAGVATLVEELTLGNGSTADEYQFSMAYVFSGPAGGVYVVDVSNAMAGGPPYQTSVRQYDRTGRFVRAFGRVGQGPGEYTGIVAAVTDLPDGRVLILERRGVNVYSASGEPVARWTTSDRPTRLFVDPPGFVHVNGASPGRGRWEPFLERFRLDGTLVDRLAPPEAAFPRPPMLAGGLLPFAPRHLVKWSPLGYFVTANTATHTIDLRLPRPRTGASTSGVLWADGDPVLSIRRTVPSIPISDAEHADWRQSLTMYYRRQNARWEWSGPELPRVKPPIRDLQVATDGRIWVRLHQPATLNRAITIRTAPVRGAEFNDVDAERRWVEPWLYDVFEPSGRYVGQVRFPDYTGPAYLPRMDFAIQGDTVWGVVHDRDDVPSVKRYRIKWGAG